MELQTLLNFTMSHPANHLSGSGNEKSPSFTSSAFPTCHSAVTQMSDMAHAPPPRSVTTIESLDHLEWRHVQRSHWLTSAGSSAPSENHEISGRSPNPSFNVHVSEKHISGVCTLPPLETVFHLVRMRFFSQPRLRLNSGDQCGGKVKK